MFEGFAETRAPGEVRRWALSAGTSVAVYAAAVAVIFTLVGTGAAAPVVKKVQVVFRPPPPAEEAPPAPARRPPPPVTNKMKVVEVEGLPPPAPLVAPPETPRAKPAEAEPSGEPVVVAIASGSRTGDYGGASIVSSSQPIHLPEAATPPQRLGNGPDPEYPEEARRAGREGLVVLKIVVDEEGRVTVADVLRGDEPFATAAVRAVRTWRYRPATLDGSPISIYRVVKVPFRLRS
jgi:protein TonB